ncbi:hypothetical protein CC85DRAFT_287511 [Cutaneotrichosporon oleaginosum]|uniref:Uncharacterized protein n=1 Tax=Cutaneotrichosporon oleaginosum TaxID=879819 RepID=A0A0J1AYM4_9TREE|nr:uncharacterized protein CC85DRAFT_287511 [Cutaneotrichosporon oleaginosum]KLT40409.1 hypothetical protein CC85DRAFT_287511 [Cutaneotrichosporon oleaginosum]TXT11374.1 hypothetical protein COLE_01784 [Cutaneotrichosporon oleaginosum]
MDHAAFPHIFERILLFSPWSTKLRLRVLSRAIRETLDAELYRHIVVYGSAEHVCLRAPDHPLPPLGEDTRALSRVQVVDWDVPLPHPALSPDDGAAEARAAALRHLAPLLSARPHTVRAADAQLVPLPAPHLILFNDYVSAAGRWLHWGEGLVLLPPGVRKLTLHTRFDPRHPALAGSTWDVPHPVSVNELEELVVIPFPAHDAPRALQRPWQRTPTLGFLDDLFVWGMQLAARGVRVTFVGLDILPPRALMMSPDVGEERERLIVAGLEALRKGGPGRGGEIRRITWVQYRCETDPDEYDLVVVRRPS